MPTISTTVNTAVPMHTRLWCDVMWCATPLPTITTATDWARWDFMDIILFLVIIIMIKTDYSRHLEWFAGAVRVAPFTDLGSHSHRNTWSAFHCILDSPFVILIYPIIYSHFILFFLLCIITSFVFFHFVFDPIAESLSIILVSLPYLIHIIVIARVGVIVNIMRIRNSMAFSLYCTRCDQEIAKKLI